MGYTKTQICNMTVSHCGISSPIRDIENDTSVQAVQCRLFFDTCVELLLEMLPWSFAEEEFTLTNLGNPPSGWGYRYAYPNNCKRVNKIVNPAVRSAQDLADKIPFKIVNINDSEGAGKAILTDQKDAKIEGNRLITDTNLFSSTFVMALSLFIASHIVTSLRVKQSMVDSVNKKWATWLSEAQTQDKAERQDDTPADSEFVSARS